MKKFNFWSLVVVCVLLIISIFVIENQRKKENQYNENVIDTYQVFVWNLMEINDSLNSRLSNIHNLTWDNIDFWIKHFEINCDTVIRAQIILETGNLTSDILINGNNLFGMKFPLYRETTAVGIYKNHASYQSYIHSIEDYRLWQQYFKFDTLKVTEDYVNCLVKHGYAKSENYKQSLYVIIEKLREDYKYFN